MIQHSCTCEKPCTGQ